MIKIKYPAREHWFNITFCEKKFTKKCNRCEYRFKCLTEGGNYYFLWSCQEKGLTRYNSHDIIESEKGSINMYQLQ